MLRLVLGRLSVDEEPAPGLEGVGRCAPSEPFSSPTTNSRPMRRSPATASPSAAATIAAARPLASQVPAAIQAGLVLAERDVGRDAVEVGGEHHHRRFAAGVEVVAARGHRLPDDPVPQAAQQVGKELHRGALGTRRRLQPDQLPRQCDGVHYGSPRGDGRLTRAPQNRNPAGWCAAGQVSQSWMQQLRLAVAPRARSWASCCAWWCC